MKSEAALEGLESHFNWVINSSYLRLCAGWHCWVSHES